MHCFPEVIEPLADLPPCAAAPLGGLSPAGDEGACRFNLHAVWDACIIEK